MIQAVAVDYGGVLVDLPSGTANVARIAAAVGRSPQALLDGVYGPGRSRWRRARVGELPEADLWAAAQRELGMTETQVDWVRRQLFDDVGVRAAVLRYLWDIRSHVRLALVSNAIPSFADTWRRLGLLELFHVVVNSSAVGLAKPDPEIFRWLLRQLDVPPAACLVVDDQAQNRRSADGLTMPTVDGADPEQTIAAIAAAIGVAPKP